MLFSLQINSYLFLEIHTTLHFDIDVKKLMIVEDSYHLRLWTSNVMPLRIQLQFGRLKFNCSSTQLAGNKGFHTLGRFSEACPKPMCLSARIKELVELELVNSIPVPSKQTRWRKKLFSICFLILCRPFIQLVGEFLSLSKISILSQKYKVTKGYIWFLLIAKTGYPQSW